MSKETDLDKLLESSSKEWGVIQKVERTEHLNGVELKDGEVLGVSWPDGQVQKLRIRVDTVCDGESCISRSYYDSKYLGKAVSVPMIGIKARRL